MLSLENRKLENVSKIRLLLDFTSSIFLKIQNYFFVKVSTFNKSQMRSSPCWRWIDNLHLNLQLQGTAQLACDKFFFDKSKFKNHFKQAVIMFWLKIIVQSQRHGAPHQPITRLEIFRPCTIEHIIWVISHGLYNMTQYYLNSMVPWNKGLWKIIEIELSSSKFSSCPWT